MTDKQGILRGKRLNTATGTGKTGTGDIRRYTAVIAAQKFSDEETVIQHAHIMIQHRKNVNCNIPGSKISVAFRRNQPGAYP